MKWTVADIGDLDLPPVVVVDGDQGGPDFVVRKVRCEETIEIDASGSYLPRYGKKRDDGDLIFKWYQYKEIGSTLPFVSGVCYSC